MCGPKKRVLRAAVFISLLNHTEMDAENRHGVFATPSPNDKNAVGGFRFTPQPGDTAVYVTIDSSTKVQLLITGTPDEKYTLLALGVDKPETEQARTHSATSSMQKETQHVVLQDSKAAALIENSLVTMTSDEKHVRYKGKIYGEGDVILLDDGRSVKVELT